MNTICLGPYKISSSHFSDELGPVFVDREQTRQVAVFAVDGVITPPADDAILLREKISEEEIIHWYECPSELGRTYSILPSPCGVSISSFENGLLLGAVEFGSDFFCFFKLYLGSNIYVGDSCSTTFEFDGHPFSVSGTQAINPGIISCDICLEEFHSSNIAMFSMLGPTQPGEGSLPSVPAEFTAPAAVADIEALEGTLIEEENRPQWITSPAQQETAISSGINCSIEDASITATIGECESQKNASMVIRPSGNAVVTYDKYDETGLPQITVAQVPTSVANKIVYHRSLSKGRLFNNSVSGSSTMSFEVFDDIATKITVQSGNVFTCGECETYGVATITISNVAASFDIPWLSTDESEALDVMVDYFNNDFKSLTLPLVDACRYEFIPTGVIGITASGKEVSFHNSSKFVHIVQRSWEFIFSINIDGSPFWNINPSFDNFDGPSGTSCSEINAFNSQTRHYSGNFDLFLLEFDETTQIQTTESFDSSLGIGFLSGPLVGNIFAIDSITGSLQDDGRPKHTLLFELGSVPLVFPDTTNDLYDVEWFLMDLTAPIGPGNTISESSANATALAAPIHLFEGKQVPTVKASSVYATNNYMLDRSEYKYTAYQAFENNTWNIYLHQSRTVDEISTEVNVNPAYEPPFDIMVKPTITFEPITGDFDTVVYEVVEQVFSSGFVLNVFVMLIVKLEDGSVVGNCLQENGAWETTAPYNSSFSKRTAYIELRYDISRCGSTGVEGFAVGSTFTGVYPPDSSVFRSAWFPCDSPGQAQQPGYEAITVIGIFPDASQWCYSKSNCIQTSAFDDPYCPNPYVAVEYKPHDLWTLSNEDNIITRVKYHMNIAISNATVVERTNSGHDATYLKPAEIIVTYNIDLSELWTNDKSSLEFMGSFPSSGDTKGLNNLPYSTIGGIFGIDSVHMVGDTSLWVYFPDSGPIKISNSQIGVNKPSQSGVIQLASNAINPVTTTNYNNEIFVAYENLEFGVSQINIKGTGDFAQNSIIGPRGSRVTEFYSLEDFAFEHSITISGEGVNQICDLVSDKSNVIHIVWQSNRDNSWEIYYANGYDLFEPVRITKFDSRSTRPSIDIDDDGNVYVVFQDNRFSRHEIMLVYKTDSRVTPLLQQDAYMASLRNNYTHYTNQMPVTISNPGDDQAAGIMWVSHNNSVFDINETTAAVTELGAGFLEPAVFGNVLAIAGSSTGFLYGVTDTNKLLQIIAPNNDPYLFIEEADVIELGTITGLPDGYVIQDATVDTLSGNLWLIMSLQGDSNVTVNISQVDIPQNPISNVTTLLSGVVYTNATSTNMSIGCISGGIFYITTERGDNTILSTSDFPHYVSNVLLFDFDDINTNLGSEIISMSSNNIDELFVIDSINQLHSVNRTSGVLSLITSSGNPGTSLSHLGYQFSGTVSLSGGPSFFHILLEFYDNIGFAGEPWLSIDSRDNLAAFTSTDAYFSSAKGIAVSPGSQTTVWFNAANFRPGYTNAAYPYGFETNQTYFSKVSRIDSLGQINPEIDEQFTSLSCNKCSAINGNDFDAHSCSYSFSLTNNGTSDSSFNFMINFFSDEDKGDLVRSFLLTPESDDLQFVEIDKVVASEKWGVLGLEIGRTSSTLIQIFPAINNESNFLCGINYHVDILLCESSNSICSSFAKSDFADDDGIFYCDCSSNIFADGQVALSQLGKWQSSGQGFADTRVTDSHQDSIKPKVNVKSSGAAIILFEDYENEQPNLKVATFRLSNTTELFGSGTRSWFDYNPDIIAKNIDSELDIQDVLSSVYEREHISSPRRNDIPATSLYSSNCDFDAEVSSSSVASGVACDITSITDNVLTSDPFIMSQVIKRITVRKEDVEYFTYNAGGIAVPVVAKCDITLQIWGTPEVVAVRFRNEEDDVFSNWCPWTPAIGDYYTEMEHTLSFNSGSKEVCIQVMTYNGVTIESCVPVIADYRKIVFELQMYADIDRTIPLPLHNNSHVASITDNNGVTTPEGQSRTIYIDIIPNAEIAVQKINFDVLQQGDKDQLDLEACDPRDPKPDGCEQPAPSSKKQVFRGQFNIFLEDNISHLDGLARIRAKLPGSCEKITERFVTASFTKEEFNLMSLNSQASIQDDTSDVFAAYRQEVSGKIGVDILLRPSNDPYLIFGDPNYFLTKKDPVQQGVISDDVIRSIDDSTPDNGTIPGDNGNNGSTTSGE